MPGRSLPQSPLAYSDSPLSRVYRAKWQPEQDLSTLVTDLAYTASKRRTLERGENGAAVHWRRPPDAVGRGGPEAELAGGVGRVARADRRARAMLGGGGSARRRRPTVAQAPGGASRPNRVRPNPTASARDHRFLCMVVALCAQNRAVSATQGSRVTDRPRGRRCWPSPAGAGAGDRD